MTIDLSINNKQVSFNEIQKTIDYLNKFKVLEFIDGFKKQYPEEITDFFAHGYCYWFAAILKERFKGIIYYSPIENHFTCYINGYYYDIEGVYTPVKYIYPWEEYKHIDKLESARIVRDCINKEPVL
jgi:hypothetical protein